MRRFLRRSRLVRWVTHVPVSTQITTRLGAGRDGRAYGVLGAHTAKRRKFNDYDVAFLAAVANVLAGAI